MLVVAGEVVAPDPDIKFWRAWAAEFVKNNTTRQAAHARLVKRGRFVMRARFVGHAMRCKPETQTARKRVIGSRTGLRAREWRR